MAKSTRTRKSTPKRRGGTAKVDPYKVVTDSIVAALEAGVVPWHRPWSTRPGGNMPMSLSMRKPYRGVNVFVLGIEAMIRGYDSRWWGTYKQIAERGGQVRKGEKGTTIVFWRVVNRPEATEDETGTAEPSKRPGRFLVLRNYVVFNVDQCDDIDDLDPPADTVEHDATDVHVRCDAIVDGYTANGGPTDYRTGGNIAGWHPVEDYVTMPPRDRFETLDAYYASLFHELGHSTGHPKRLNRKEAAASVSFGTPDYGIEELVAEMSAAFVCGEAGIDVNVESHAGYIAGWLRALNDDRKMVVHAAARAQKAADMILVRPVAGDDTNGNDNGTGSEDA